MEEAAGLSTLPQTTVLNGRKGMVTAVIEELVKNEGKTYDVCVAIGPMIMMKFVAKLTKELGIQPSSA